MPLPSTRRAGKSRPPRIAARTNFIAGTKGSGKTYTAGVMVGGDARPACTVVILDPLGVWWGLRHDAGGGPGGYPIVILGGEHGDRPLLPTAGEIVAEYIVRSGQSVILDMSGFASNAEQDRFVTDLLHKLFRLKAAEKSALHLMIDEADMFVPRAAADGERRSRCWGRRRRSSRRGAAAG
jgi:DNA helicase HerA-like ATPase